MIKRAIPRQFRHAILDREKTSIICNSEWPRDTLIMLYSWKGVPYQSEQEDLIPIIVTQRSPIRVLRAKNGKGLLFKLAPGEIKFQPIHSSEGFRTKQELSDWFVAHWPKGALMQEMVLHRFSVIDDKNERRVKRSEREVGPCEQRDDEVES